jgi:hypothetical protein
MMGIPLCSVGANSRSKREILLATGLFFAFQMMRLPDPPAANAPEPAAFG